MTQDQAFEPVNPSSEATADLWMVRVDDASVLSEAQRHLLAPEERERALRFRFERDRHLYETSRVLVRTVLSRHEPVHPAAWRFVPDQYGKPRIAGPAGQGLSFSLTHTPGLVCCAVTNHLRIGVDAESAERSFDVGEVADRCLAPAERQQLGALTEAGQRLRFFEYWTLKESLAKAIGVGLYADFSRFAFRFTNDTIGVTIDGAPLEDCTWQFHLFRPTTTHTLALAVQRPGPAPVWLRTRAVSLRDLH